MALVKRQKDGDGDDNHKDDDSHDAFTALQNQEIYVISYVRCSLH
jgi:hypothetical protein